MGYFDGQRKRRETVFSILGLSVTLIAILLSVNTTADAQRSVRTQMVGGSGGKLSEYTCGPGRVLVGVRGYAGVWLDNIQAICATVEADGLTNTRPEGPVFGGARPFNGSAQCPGDSLLRTVQVTETENSPYVGRIGVNCRDQNVTLELRGSGHLKGYTSPFAGLPSREDLIGGVIECPEVAVGISVRTSDFLDAFGLICGPKPKTLGKRKKPTPPEVGKPRANDSPDRTTVPGIDKPTGTATHQPGPSGTGAQPPSTNMDKPAAVTTPDLKGQLREGAAKTFHTLTVGPGEVVFTLKVTGGSPGGGAVYFYILQPETKNIEADFWLFSLANASGQVIKKIEYAEERTIVLEKGEEIGTGSYQLSISGAVRK